MQVASIVNISLFVALVICDMLCSCTTVICFAYSYTFLHYNHNHFNCPSFSTTSSSTNSIRLRTSVLYSTPLTTATSPTGISSTSTCSVRDSDNDNLVEKLLTHQRNHLKLPTATDTDAINNVKVQCTERAQNQHDHQYQSGVKVFGCSTGSDNCDDSNSHSPQRIATTSIWSDDDFNSYTVRKGYAGPYESLLQNGNVIYETKGQILTKEECNDFINAARQTIQKDKMEQQLEQTGSSNASRATERSNSDLGEARLSKLPQETLDQLRTLLQTKLYPLLTSRFGSTLALTVYDGLILGHIAPSHSQPVHRDASLLTLNIPLSSFNEDFIQGGGTYIEGLDDDDDDDNINNGLPICIEKGKVLCHSSGIMHAGVGIGQGERWVMVLFLIAKQEPQIARRCHAEGLYAINAQKLDKAMDEFQTGLSFSPNDHLLHMGIGQIASIYSSNQDLDEKTRNEMTQLSMDCLSISSTLYPPSHNAAIALGKMLLMKRKPRAALRRFDSVLSIIDDKDLVDGSFLALKAQAWDVRVFAARCAILCAEEWVRLQEQRHQGDPSIFFGGWSNKLRMEEAIERLRIAMIPVPHDEQLLYLMNRAHQLKEYY